jgi:hypothetical protein
MDADEQQPAVARRVHKRRAEREALLRARLLPDETVVAQRRGVLVTDRRVLAWMESDLTLDEHPKGIWHAWFTKDAFEKL